MYNLLEVFKMDAYCYLTLLCNSHIFHHTTLQGQALKPNKITKTSQ